LHQRKTVTAKAPSAAGALKSGETRPEVWQFVTPSKAIETPEWVAEERCYPQKARDVPCHLNATDEEKATSRALLEFGETAHLKNVRQASL
jgi:hypothetical protein